MLKTSVITFARFNATASARKDKLESVQRRLINNLNQEILGKHKNYLETGHLKTYEDEGVNFWQKNIYTRTPLKHKVLMTCVIIIGGSRVQNDVLLFHCSTMRKMTAVTSFVYISNVHRKLMCQPFLCQTSICGSQFFVVFFFEAVTLN